MSIRYRIDGDLVEVLTPRKLAAPLVSRIKVMARLDIAEKRLPQDGRISLQAGGRSIDVRVAILPTVSANASPCVSSIRRTALLTLEQLGMDSDTYQRFDKVLGQPKWRDSCHRPCWLRQDNNALLEHLAPKYGQREHHDARRSVEYGLPGDQPGPRWMPRSASPSPGPCATSCVRTSTS